MYHDCFVVTWLKRKELTNLCERVFCDPQTKFFLFFSQMQFRAIRKNTQSIRGSNARTEVTDLPLKCEWDKQKELKCHLRLFDCFCGCEKIVAIVCCFAYCFRVHLSVRVCTRTPVLFTRWKNGVEVRRSNGYEDIIQRKQKVNNAQSDRVRYRVLALLILF